MPPKVALAGCIIAIVGVIYFFDNKEKKDVSLGLLIPLIWMCVLGSRNISQFFMAESAIKTTDDYLVGSPVDRLFFSILIIIGVCILIRRNIPFCEIVRQNIWIFVFLLYCGVSAVWSDYPGVSLKRFIKNIGNIVMVLIVITEIHPKNAFRLLIKRFSYILLPLSVVLYKYFSHLGRAYNSFNGKLIVTGITNNKNTLGAVCLISSMFYIWNLFLNKEYQGFERKFEYYGSCIILLISLILLHMSNCSTADLCLVFGLISLLVFMKTKFILDHIPGLKICLYASVAMIIILLTGATKLNLQSLVSITGNVTGHEDTFFGRVLFWPEIINLSSNSVFFGEGYDSYWLGDRIRILWDRYWWHPTEAHNGYVEIYLELGVIGLLIFFAVFRSCFNKLIKGIKMGEEDSIFRFVLFITVMLYNIPETAIKGTHIMWFLFLLVTMEYRYTDTDVDWKIKYENAV
jgi:O-antigen ligase